MEKQLQKKGQKSLKIFHGKEDWHLNNASSDYRNSPQNLKREREPQNGKKNRFKARKRNSNSQRNT